MTSSHGQHGCLVVKKLVVPNYSVQFRVTRWPSSEVKILKATFARKVLGNAR